VRGVSRIGVSLQTLSGGVVNYFRWNGDFVVGGSGASDMPESTDSKRPESLRQVVPHKLWFAGAVRQ